MRFYKKIFAITSVMLFVALFFYLRNVLTIDADFYAGMQEMRKQEKFSGKVLAKYIDSANHNTPKLKLPDAAISVENDFYEKISIGDSIYKKAGDYNITVYRIDGSITQLNYKDYFDKLAGKVKYNNKFYPRQKGFVNDYGKVFTEDEVTQLNEILSNYDRASANKIILLTIHDSGDDDFKTYVDTVGEKWHINLNNDGRTILLVFSAEDRKVAMSVGKNVTGFSESAAADIVTFKVIPELKRNAYYSGIKKCIDEMIAHWK